MLLLEKIVCYKSIWNTSPAKWQNWWTMACWWPVVIQALRE